MDSKDIGKYTLRLTDDFVEIIDDGMKERIMVVSRKSSTLKGIGLRGIEAAVRELLINGPKGWEDDRPKRSK